MFLKPSKSEDFHEVDKRERHVATPHLSGMALALLKRQEIKLSCNETEKPWA